MHPDSSPASSFGAALRRRRCGRGLTLAELGRLVHVSPDLLGKIELATRHPQRDLIARLDDALDAGGELVRLEPPARRAHRGVHERGRSALPAGIASSIDDVRAVLMDHRQLPSSVFAADALSQPSTPATVRHQVGELFAAYQGGRFAYVASRLPHALSTALQTARSADQSQSCRLNGLLALTYQAAASVLAKFGETDLAWIAAERGVRAADQAADPLVVGSLLRSYAYTMHSTGRFTDAVQLVQQTADHLQPHLTGRGRMLSVYGTLFLTGAVAAARAQDRQTSTAYLNEAHGCAARLGVDGNAMWTAFGPTNVALHRMTVAVELGDIQTALDLTERIDASRLPPERRVRHAIDTARAQSAAGRSDKALTVLLDAERFAPEQVRTHAISRRLVSEWLHDGQAHRRTEVRRLADRLAAS